MHRASLPVRVVALACALALFILAGSGALAVADDFLVRDVLPEGSTIAGLDVSGMTRNEAREFVEAEVAAPLGEPLSVRHEGRTFTLDAGLMIEVDVAGMVEAAFEPRLSALLPYRVVDRVMERPAGGNAEVAVTLDQELLQAWLAEVSRIVDTTPSDATMTVDAGKILVVPSQVGTTVDLEATKAALEEALVAGDKDVELAVVHTEPAVTEEDLDTAILVDVSERRLYLYDDGELVKQYGVAVGAPGFPTPKGNFQIVLKRFMPTWSNPGSAWASDMPKSIAPGPSNPLGTRALNLDAPGIRIHGTNKDSSIGTAASHGCMRMHRWDIEDLYDRVDVGTPVFIVS
jgi:lipoprotein-anchoring transpeptidase ErfK/SrfK